MKTESYTTSFTVDQSPDEVFDAINNVRGGGQEKSRAIPTNSAPSLPTVSKTCTVPNKR